MKKLLFVLVVVLGVSRGFCYWYTDYTTHTFVCQLCNVTTYYSHLTHVVSNSPEWFDKAWIARDKYYYHEDCWLKFQEFLIDLYQKEELKTIYKIDFASYTINFEECEKVGLYPELPTYKTERYKTKDGYYIYYSTTEKRIITEKP